MSDSSKKFKSRDLQMVQNMLAQASSDSQIRDVLVSQGYIEPDADELIQYAREQLAAAPAPAPTTFIRPDVEMNPRDIALVKDMRASSIPDYKIRDALLQRGYNMDDAIQLMKNASSFQSNSFEKFKRKRSDQPYYPPATSGGSSDGSKVALGLLIAGIGCAITFFTYSSASSSSSGGTYIVAYGPIIWGVVLIVKGLMGKD
jgi:hypothetical protein